MSITNIKVPSGVYNLSVAGPVTAVAEFKDGVATGKQQVNEDGVAMWRVPVLIATDTELNTEKLKFPSSTEPKFTLGTPLVYDVLTINPVGDRTKLGVVNFYFSVGSLSAAEKARS